MPEAAVNENHGVLFAQYDVRTSWKLFYVLSVTEALREKIFSDLFFRFGIFASDVRHIFMPILF